MVSDIKEILDLHHPLRLYSKCSICAKIMLFLIVCVCVCNVFRVS